MENIDLHSPPDILLKNSIESRKNDFNGNKKDPKSSIAIQSVRVLAKYQSYDPEQVLLPSSEAAAVALMSPRTLEKHRQKRKFLPFIRTPGGVFYKLSDLLKYRQENTIQPVTDEVA